LRTHCDATVVFGLARPAGPLPGDALSGLSRAAPFAADAGSRHSGTARTMP